MKIIIFSIFFFSYIAPVIQINENILHEIHGKRILLAVSGGLDSVCMLDYFAKNAIEFGVTLAVAHIDHGIRGLASAEDAEFVREITKKYGLPFYFKSLGDLLVNAPNVEERARELRYEILHRFKKEGNFDFIATAHHGDDQAETLYMRLARGTSLIGLRGVKTFREDGVFRPFLSIFRENLCQYAKENCLKWREDSTNADNAYRRNFIRNEVLPRLEKSTPGIKASFCRIAWLATKVNETIFKKAEDTFSGLVIAENQWPFAKECSPYKRVLAMNFARLSNILESLGTGGEELFRIWLNTLGFDVPLGSERSPIFPLPDRKLELRSLCLEKSLNCLWILDLRSIVPKRNLYFLTAKNMPEQGKVWRYRKDGDLYSPAGMKCKHRKLSKWLQETGIPPFVRDYIPFLAKGDCIIRMARSTDLEE